MTECIEKQAALKAVCDACGIIPDREKENCQYKFDGCKEYYNVSVLPPVDVRPVVRGKWIDMGDFISCSSCNAARLKEFESDYGKVRRLDVRTNFCPNCGADMEDKEPVDKFEGWSDELKQAYKEMLEKLDLLGGDTE